MKNIDTKGITFLEPLAGSQEWYWGMDYTSGDLYEAEELFKQGHPIDHNRLIFIHYPDGRAVQPMAAEKGQYFGRPVYYEHKIMILMVDFTAEKINIIQFDAAAGQTSLLAAIPLSDVEDCYNLMLDKSPLMLTRHGHGADKKFQILWPQAKEFHIGNTEFFYLRAGKKLYFSAWYEDPDYREEIIVRDLYTGEIIDRLSGTIMVMPDEQIWVLT